MLTIRDIIQSTDFSYLSLLNEDADLNREINAIESTETPDVSNYLPKNTFLLTTGMAFQNDPEAFCSFISSLDNLPIAGIGIKLGRYIEKLDPMITDHANRLNFPLVQISKEQTLGSVSHHLLSYLWDNQAGAMEMALNLQKQFSDMMLKGSTIENLIKYLGSILKVPLILENPFFEIIATSQHYSSSKYSIGSYKKDREAFLNDKKRTYLKTQSKNSFQNDYYYIHPIKMDAFLTFYLILKKQNNDTFPLSSLMLEQASVVLSHTIYKNLKLVEETMNTKKSFFVRLLNKDQRFMDKTTDWFEYGKEFNLIQSDYYRIGFCEFFTDQPSFTNPETEKLRLLLIYKWVENLTTQFEENIILFPTDTPNRFGILFQSDKDSIEEKLVKINDAFQKSSLFRFQFYLGNPVFSVHDIHYSYKEALEAAQSTERLKENPLILYYETKKIQDLIHYIPEHVRRHFALATLKELAYPEEESVKELRHTLKVFLESQSEIKLSSERLFIHRNTVKYRIAKCKELLNTTLENPNDVLNLRVALEITEEDMV